MIAEGNLPEAGIQEDTEQSHCAPIDGEERHFTYVWEHSLTDPTLDPQGLNLMYWVEAGDGTTPPSCHELGGGVDGVPDPDDDLDYGPLFNRSMSLTSDEETACRDALADRFGCTGN